MSTSCASQLKTQVKTAHLLPCQSPCRVSFCRNFTGRFMTPGLVSHHGWWVSRCSHLWCFVDQTLVLQLYPDVSEKPPRPPSCSQPPVVNASPIFRLRPSTLFFVPSDCLRRQQHTNTGTQHKTHWMAPQKVMCLAACWAVQFQTVRPYHKLVLQRRRKPAQQAHLLVCH